MINKVYLIWGSWYIDINNLNFEKQESDYLSWKMKNSTYWFDITKFFIDKYGKDNVVNCLVKWEWEYKNILWYKWYYKKWFKLFKEIWKNRKNSLVIFHWLYPWVLIFSVIPCKHKAWWRHAIIWPYNRASKKIKWCAMIFIQIFFQIFIKNIFFVNNIEKNELKKLHFKWNLIFLPISINTTFWRNNTRIKELINSNINITCVWNIWPNKNQLTIIKSLLNFTNITLNLVWWSLDDIYLDTIKKYINDNNLWNVILHWKLEPEKIKKILEYTDIYIQSSFQEWQCQTVMEAWLTGCPLILSDIPTFKDTFEKFALFFNPNDEEELWNKINEMIDNHYKYNNNIELIDYIENWSIENFFNQLEKFNTEILKYEQNGNTHN